MDLDEVNTELSRLDGLAQAQLLKDKQLSALELVDAAIRRIQVVEPYIQALSSYDFERARQEARLCKSNSGPFSGVPFLIKDNISYPHHPLTYGSRLFIDHIGYETTPFVQNMETGGFVILGKTTTSEFSLLPSTETLLRGATRNPWNITFSAAGSSGGAAAAVASGMIPLAHANDVGGSIRIPASVCGLFGFKPSIGRCYASSNSKNNLASLMSNHCISKSVRDSACFLALTEIKGLNRVYAPIGFVTSPIGRSLKIGVHSDNLMATKPSNEVIRALNATIKLCQSLGHNVEYITLPDLSGEDICDAFMLYAGSTISDIAKVMAQSTKQPREKLLFEPFTHALIDWFNTSPKNSLEEARTVFAQASKEIAVLLDQYDVLLSPTMAMEGFSLGDLSPTSDFNYLVNRIKAISAYTSIYNINGAAAMSVPLEQSCTGFPIGMHFSARAGDDKTLLELAYQLESAKPWQHLSPKYSYTHLQNAFK